MKPHLEQFERETRARVEARLEAGEFKDKFDKKYGKLVDIKGMHNQLDYFDQVLAQAQRLADTRASDHVYWARSERLLRALERYDNSDLISGLAFAEQTGRCIIGMELCVSGSTLLDQWWRSDPASPSNLAMRGITANQDDIRDEVAALITAAKAEPPTKSPLEIPTAITGRAHAVASAFGRINTLYEQLQSQNSSASVGLYAWYTALGRQVLRTGAPNSGDRVIHLGLRMLLMASVHKNALDVRLSEAERAGQNLNRQRVSQPVARYLDQAWAEGLMQAHKSDFYKVRTAGLILLLEGMLMGFKASELPDSDIRVKAQMAAAGFTTVAAGIEVGASYVEQVLTRYGPTSVTGRGAEVVLGRLKLLGATFAGVGGGILAWWDFADGNKYYREAVTGGSEQPAVRSRLLSTAYFARAMAAVALSVAEAGAAIAIAKPFFDYLAHRTQNKVIRTFAFGMSQFASKLGTQVFRLILTRIVLGAFWVGLAITLIIWVFDDDALEKWCKASLYRLNRKADILHEETELPELFSALKGVI